MSLFLCVTLIHCQYLLSSRLPVLEGKLWVSGVCSRGLGSCRSILDLSLWSHQIEPHSFLLWEYSSFVSCKLAQLDSSSVMFIWPIVTHAATMFWQIVMDLWIEHNQVPCYLPPFLIFFPQLKEIWKANNLNSLYKYTSNHEMRYQLPLYTH